MIYEEEVRSLVESKAKGKNIVLMGRLEHLQTINKIISSAGEKVWRVWDNDRHKQGNYMADILIEAPHHTLDLVFIIIYSPRYFTEMKEQLLKLGYAADNIYVLDCPTLEKNKIMVRNGWELYSQLCARYGADTKFFLVSGPLGDYYILGTYIRQYCELHNIKKYLFIGDSKGIDRLTILLGLQARKIDAYAVSCLSLLWKFLGGDRHLNIMPLTIWQGDYRFNPCLTRQRKDFNFMDTFKHLALNLPVDARQQHPPWNYNPVRGERIFRKNNLRKGHTVLLVPFSYTLTSFGEEFWQKLIDLLIFNGYDVVINTSEKEINVYKRASCLQLGFTEIMDAMSYGMSVVGMRCGFFDITARAKCKRIVLYPMSMKENVSWHKSDISFCSLKRMGECVDAYEWEVENIQELYPRILTVLENEVENE